ncbi:hypothetical protein CONPUDRAFT_104558 [Coniophora puteana RWD-64-598 SS2]|uniref:DUF202 domain-containing protein n=1 Tax=Coniophora puteana (strain RWD-64-598) TaxID=741705 RepID=A0A5M3MQ29_CONPW|nr:uncharacterized protein CONPUDRAFT_104558 [Coniophora puteana RWD-64-598 SS2]EIW81253.1 hypothetical protein CONPUDRAFT_104558 [Coniophora puteana RWD-64-598 SS2]
MQRDQNSDRTTRSSLDEQHSTDTYIDASPTADRQPSAESQLPQCSAPNPAPCPKTSDSEPPSPSRFKSLIAPFKLSLVLENKGNVARDHLASERTYLAYVRTSLACSSAGVALVQLFTLSANTLNTPGINLEQWARPLGAVIILLGLLVLIYGVVRYFTTQAALIRGYYPIARNSLTGLAFVLGTIIGVVFGILVAGTKY